MKHEIYDGKQAEELFEIKGMAASGVSKWDAALGKMVELPAEEQVFIGTKRTVDFYHSYKTRFVMTEYKSIGKVWPKGATIQYKGGNGGRCWNSATYEVVSPVALTDFDFDVLRAQESFMNGQIHGEVRDAKVVDGKFVYTVYSFCDSSD